MASNDFGLGAPLPGPLQIVVEYDELKPFLSHGMFVVPDTVDLYLWHGLLLVREGRYRGGVFRFIVCIHPLHPADSAKPLVVFLDKPHHPLVDPASGALQLEARFTTWRREGDRLPPVIEFVRDVLTSDLVLQPPAGKKAFDPIAVEQWRGSHDEFDAAAAASAQAAATMAIRRVAASSGVASIPAVGGDLEDAAAWALSPYTATIRMTHDNGSLTPAGRAAALEAAAIAYRRGFRLTEPSPIHEAIVREVASGAYEGTGLTDMLIRGMPADSAIDLGLHLGPTTVPSAATMPATATPLTSTDVAAGMEGDHWQDAIAWAGAATTAGDAGGTTVPST